MIQHSLETFSEIHYIFNMGVCCSKFQNQEEYFPLKPKNSQQILHNILIENETNGILDDPQLKKILEEDSDNEEIDEKLVQKLINEIDLS